MLKYFKPLKVQKKTDTNEDMSTTRQRIQILRNKKHGTYKTTLGKFIVISSCSH